MEQKYHYYPDGESIADESQMAFDNPYRWSGKEWDEVLGSYDFGARLFSAADSRWTTPDRLCEKFYPVSPYAYCAGDPVNKIDSFGLDIYYFNEDGSYSHKIKQEGTHLLAVVSHDKEGNSYTRHYDFADPINDPAGIDNGEITNIEFVSENRILDILSSTGTFDRSIGKYAFIKASNSLSISTYSFDYSSSVLPKWYSTNIKEGMITSKYLFLVQGDTYVHNIMNFGNYLWAASGYSLKISLLELKLGAHANSLGLFGKSNRNYNGYPPQFDSKDDQLSITEGFIHAKKNKYRKNRK